MIAVIFPGQGSQRPGMGASLAGSFSEAADVFERTSEAVGFDVLRLCTESDDAVLRQTENAQIALFTCGVAAFNALSAECPAAQVVATAGHSIGEYAACVAAGALTLEDGARLVHVRGRLMADAGRTAPGAMAAVIGLERGPLEDACREAGGIAVVANDNSPGQLVISGETEAISRASDLAKAKGAKRVIPLNVSGAFHSPLMRDAAREMGEAMRGVTFRAPAIALYSNVTAEPVGDPAEIPGLFERQLSSPVRWTESVRNMARDGIDTFFECGVGEVLCGLNRRIEPSVQTLAIHDVASLKTALDNIGSPVV